MTKPNQITYIMNKHTQNSPDYVSPTLDLLEIHIEGTICTSVTTDAIIIGGFTDDPDPLNAI